MQLSRGAEPFPGYRLDRILGRGGWGEVWRALRSDNSELALKFVPTQSQTAAVQEIRALQSIRELRHPNLIHIEKVWCCAGYLVIAMEMAEGSLQDLLDIYRDEFQSPIFPEHACFFLSQAAEAVDFLNARQHMIDGQRVAIRHCDIKPSNILLQGKTVKLADFSLVVQTSSTLVNHRRTGTLHYAAPEVFQGLLSDRTDQYALAVTYCHIRSGRLPFTDSPSTFKPDYVRPTPDLSELSTDERSIIARALNQVPNDRWPSCKEMLRRLSACHTRALAGA
jgi:serine/threonine protein kinase